MSERMALGATMETMTLEEPGAEQASPRAPGPLRCGPCAVWPRQQTWLCVVPLLMGFVGLGLSLMLLKWIVVGSVQDYVPTDLVDANRIGQDPIFLSKPSALPKGPNGSTSAISIAPSAAPGSATRAAEDTGTVQRTRIGQSSNHTASSSSSSGGGGGALGGGSGNRAPHLHNRVGTRVTNTTTRATSLDPPGGKEVTPRSTTVRKPNGEGGSRNASPSARAGSPSTTPSKTMTISTTGTTTTQAAQPTSTLASPSKPSQRWNHGRSSKSPSTKPTRPHHRFRTFAPTTSTVRSEFFKPCQDSQEMAFCLNEGECFIIETVAGVHRHCRCKEGYRGLRCDQFVPKTDSILSDPTDELGIEFMESGETYHRQILSIFIIAVGISLLGVACMAIYCKNKRQRAKHQAHLTEIRNLTDCTVNTSSLMSKSSPRTESALQLKKSRRAHGSSSQQASGVVLSSSKVSLPNHNHSLSMGKRCRSCSLSSSPSLKQKVTNYRAVSKWTPPISRAGYHLSGGSRDSIHSYKHLQEVEMMPESLRRCQSHLDSNQQSRSNSNIQIVVSTHTREKMGYTDVPCTRLDQRAAFPPPSIRAHSVPIIPSVQGPEFGEGPGEGGGSKLHNRGRVSTSYNLINPETEVESVANSRQTLASSSVTVQEPQTLTCSESALMSRGQVKHKSLVTYTTALGSGMGSQRAKTVISMTVLGTGLKTTQHTASLLSKAAGGQGSEHVQSTFGATSGQEQGDGLQTPFLGKEKDSCFSNEIRDVACLTYPKS
ncbi:pro-neuregulin-3, membrane-bound isoform-like isoform X2 [Myxocyprinus asiaticus]|uniref:pro-neuregulin-3, membrane-bound isoform-like isoform X2 n=1 Tax=Myxocyprinus asiaticus TaxID=70543 RepID=UPI002221C07C|nr:pro-neuregulin-3, membrane-bound isoform-like isoform X2 [Myxocyprinus asiaticus]